MISYPAGPIVPHGAYHHLKGRIPTVTLWAYDDSVKFSMMGGQSIPDRTMPESVSIKKDGIKGLIAPWDIIDQKGATEDGVTFVDALQGPTEVEIKVICRGRDPQHLRKVVRHLLASIDKKLTSELSFIGQNGGRWWSDIRWFKGPPEAYKIGEAVSQEITLVLRADNGFWRTFNDTDSFQFVYDAMTDKFNVDHTATQNLGAVPQYYMGTGGGYCTSKGGQMIWVDDPAHPFSTHSREVVNGPWPGFDTTSNNQVISQVHGGFQEASLPESARNTLWGRKNRKPDGSWGGDGVRLYYGIGWIRLSYFINFVEVAVLRERPLLFPPALGEKFTLICGYDGNERMFKVQRNGADVPGMTVVESGAGSKLGPDHRGVGNGMFAAAALITQATPSPILKLSAGDNATVSQSGFLRRKNIGDQPMSDKYTVFGPGTFKFAVSPGSSEMIEFGPLLPNQVVRIDTSRQTPKIKDLTSVPPTPQDLDGWQQAWKDFIDWATANNVPILSQQIESVFGIVPPQGNLYSLLKGRWNKDSVIPAKSPGVPDSQVQPYFVKVSIEGGNADSKVIASGTPLRRYPL
ncbi:hypothetical protein M2272_005848 [Mycobacterium frederiksbergense]|uniref:DUF7257 domain-containing protein n=1 Tax=Mycolicibacterium frederiksbergense TaxID=117567 RepID=A0ABT6L9X8_9MYCO|nr:hypothetical protein [Mycolicibacterium frederiksbergense]MDH6199180.1 hypothetical protein [Mycolicibacterium frederiksbergense]